jgi:hypothetical protein
VVVYLEGAKMSTADMVFAFASDGWFVSIIVLGVVILGLIGAVAISFNRRW